MATPKEFPTISKGWTLVILALASWALAFVLIYAAVQAYHALLG